MLGRQLKEAKYRALETDLLRYGRSKPLCPIYEIDMDVNGAQYTLFLQTERRNRLYALYALRSVYEWDVGAVGHELITDNLVLSALMELLIAQGLKRP